VVFFILSTAAFVLILVWAEFREWSKLRAASKTLASFGFLAVGVSSGLLHSQVGSVVLLGLGFGLIGDVFLLSRDHRVFLAGLVSFLFNHVAYVVAFALIGISWSRFGLAFLPILGVAFLVWKWLSPHTGSLSAAVGVYILTISVMVAAAIGSVHESPALLLGASLFFVSDLCVARDRFVSPGPENRLLGLPLYYTAQLVFAYSGAQ